MALHMLNISEVLQKKTALKKVDYTVHTRRDGSRYRTNNHDDTITELPRIQTQGNKDAYMTSLEEDDLYRNNLNQLCAADEKG
jgi:hypothetical protein